MHITISSKGEARKLLRAPFSSWRFVAVHIAFERLDSSEQQDSQEDLLMLRAVTAWPDYLACKAVSAFLGTPKRPGFFSELRAAAQGPLRSLQHVTMADLLPHDGLLPASVDRLTVHLNVNKRKALVGTWTPPLAPVCCMARGIVRV